MANSFGTFSDYAMIIGPADKIPPRARTSKCLYLNPCRHRRCVTLFRPQEELGHLIPTSSGFCPIRISSRSTGLDGYRLGSNRRHSGSGRGSYARCSRRVWRRAEASQKDRTRSPIVPDHDEAGTINSPADGVVSVRWRPCVDGYGNAFPDGTRGVLTAWFTFDAATHRGRSITLTLLTIQRRSHREHGNTTASFPVVVTDGNGDPMRPVPCHHIVDDKPTAQ